MRDCHEMDTTGLPTRFHRKKAAQYFKKVKFAEKQANKLTSVNPERAGFIEKDIDEIVTQEVLRKNVDLGSASKQFDLTLDSGSCSLNYSRNGRYLALCGNRGHIAAFDWMTKRLLFETNVEEECRDIKFLHQETFISVAQKGYTYIYDNQGVELHCLKRMAGIQRLEFLPFHFLLVGMARNGFIYYLDASVGEIVASYPTFLGSLNVSCQNPANASILTGHPSGAVSVWIPTEKTPVVKILCHNSGVKSISVDRGGQYLATSGLDRNLKIWDLRNTYTCVSEITLPTPAVTMDFSQMGLLALGSSTTVQVLRDPAVSLGNLVNLAAASSANMESAALHTKVDGSQGRVHRRVVRGAYLTHHAARPVHQVAFCPFEDVLGVGTSAGFSSLLCPGAGEPHFDALEENPFANTKYRQEREVRRLLDKIPYTMISVDSMLNKVRRQDIEEEWAKKRQALLGEIPKVPMPKVKRTKKKGASKASKVEQRKQLVRFNRKQFEISALLREKVARKNSKTAKEGAKKAASGALPSDVLVAQRRAKKRSNSALDVLIPRKMME